MPWAVSLGLRIPESRWRGCGRCLFAAATALALSAHAADNGEPTGDQQPLVDQGELYDQRIDYQRAVAAVRAGRSREFRRTAAKLGDYPLKIYLDYYQAQGRTSVMSAKRAKELRVEFAESPIGERFYRQWLNAQVRRGRWEVYLANYEPSDSAAARCNYLRALYRSGERAAALAEVGDLWVAPESQPKTCDPLFDVWIAGGHLDQDTVWARLTLALEARETTLARYLLRFFDTENAVAGRLYYHAHVRPRTVRSLSRFPEQRRRPAGAPPRSAALRRRRAGGRACAVAAGGREPHILGRGSALRARVADRGECGRRQCAWRRPGRILKRRCRTDRFGHGRPSTLAPSGTLGGSTASGSARNTGVAILARSRTD